MRRRLLPLGAVVVIVLLHAPGASAATRGQVSWWTRSPAASAPEGGLAVANAPDGPVSVAAVQIDLDEGVSSASLTFAQTGGAAATAAQIVACVLSGGVAAAAGGPIEEAPATTCDGAQVAVTSTNGTWKADLTDLLVDRKGSVGVAIVPATGSTSVFDLQFDAPQLQATASSSSSGPSGSGTSPYGPTTFSSPSTTAYRAPAPSQSFSTPPPRVQSPTVTTLAPSTTTTMAGEGEPIDQIAFAGNRGDAETGSTGRPIGQAITMVVIAALIGVVGGVAHKVIAMRAA